MQTTALFVEIATQTIRPTIASFYKLVRLVYCVAKGGKQVAMRLLEGKLTQVVTYQLPLHWLALRYRFGWCLYLWLVNFCYIFLTIHWHSTWLRGRTVAMAQETPINVLRRLSKVFLRETSIIYRRAKGFMVNSFRESFMKIL